MNYSDIQKQLLSHNLQDTFPLILQKARKSGQWELTDEVERLWNTYQQMMQFMLQGVKDPQSERIREDICSQLYAIVTRLSRQERMQSAPTTQYALASRSVSNMSSLESIVNHLEDISKNYQDINNDPNLRDSIRQHQMQHLAEDIELTVQQLFAWVWTSDTWQNGDLAQANRVIFSDDISSNEKAIFITAVTLSLFEYIDATKLLFLLDSYLMDDEQVAQRALVGFLLIIHIYYDEVKDNQDLIDRMSVYQDNETFRHDIFSAMMQLEMSCTTENVTSKMRNDILPTLMNAMNKGGANPLNMKDLAEHGENPEWMDDKTMSKKMKEMAEMQRDGSDVYFASFSSMKGYAFFHQMVHWFYIFSENSPALINNHVPLSNKIVKILFKGSPFCNSDKYSLLFTFASMGSMNSTIESQISSMMPGDMSEEELMNNLEDLEAKKKNKIEIRRHYILDLYRFYQLYNYRSQFINPFQKLKEKPITPLGNDLLTELVNSDREQMIQYADFLMLKGFYEPARDLYRFINDTESEESSIKASLWQKLGFCFQKMNQKEQAIASYKYANIMKPNSKWTLAHLAEMLFNEEKIDESVKYYQQLTEICPDKKDYLEKLSNCYFLMERYEDALAIDYKLSFLDEESSLMKIRLTRDLLLLNRKDEAARQIYALEMNDPNSDVTKELKAYLMLIDDHRQEAFDLLRPLIASGSFSIDDFKDINKLEKQGLIDHATVILFKDALTLIDTQS